MKTHLALVLAANILTPTCMMLQDNNPIVLNSSLLLFSEVEVAIFEKVGQTQNYQLSNLR